MDGMASPADPAPADSSSARPPAPGELDLIRQFVNTVEFTAGEMDEELVDSATLARWLRERKLLGPNERLSAADLPRAIAVREALRGVLESHHGPAHGSPEQAAEPTEVLNRAATRAPLRVAFDPDGVAALAPSAGGLDGALARLFAIIERATVEGTWARLKVCADEECRWAFYDQSRNRSGAWCRMEVCGNRAKARAYRRRQRSGRRSG